MYRWENYIKNTFSFGYQETATREMRKLILWYVYLKCRVVIYLSKIEDAIRLQILSITKLVNIKPLWLEVSCKMCQNLVLLGIVLKAIFALRYISKDSIKGNSLSLLIFIKKDFAWFTHPENNCTVLTRIYRK